MGVIPVDVEVRITASGCNDARTHVVLALLIGRRPRVETSTSSESGENESHRTWNNPSGSKVPKLLPKACGAWKLVRRTYCTDKNKHDKKNEACLSGKIDLEPFF